MGQRQALVTDNNYQATSIEMFTHTLFQALDAGHINGTEGLIQHPGDAVQQIQTSQVDPFPLTL